MQAVRWNLHNEKVFLSGGYDGRLNVQDVRSDKKCYRLDTKISKDIESLNWHSKSEFNFVCTTEAGFIYGFDTRKFTAPTFQVRAHKK